MATVNISFLKAAKEDGYGLIAYVIDSETITSSGTSSQSTVTSNGRDVCRVAVSGNNVHVTFGPNATADTDDLMIIDGGVEYFSLNDGDEVAVIDAS